MTDAILSYRAMAYNNGWANHRLLAACARLSPSEFIAPRTGFFPSVRATLNHILVVDLFYVDAMEGGTLGPAAWADPEPCVTMDGLRQAQADVDRRLIAVVERLDTHGLERVVEVHRTCTGKYRGPVARSPRRPWRRARSAPAAPAITTVVMDSSCGVRE